MYLYDTPMLSTTRIRSTIARFPFIYLHLVAHHCACTQCALHLHLALHNCCLAVTSRYQALSLHEHAQHLLGPDEARFLPIRIAVYYLAFVCYVSTVFCCLAAIFALLDACTY